MPSQLFDSTSQSLLYLSLPRPLQQPSSFTPARLSSSFAFNRTCLLSTFISFLFLFIRSVPLSSVEERKRRREKERERAGAGARVSCSFYCLYTHIPVCVRRLSFTFSFYRALYFLRYRCLGRSSKFRAGVHAKRPLSFAIQVPRDSLMGDFLEILHLTSAYCVRWNNSYLLISG